MPTLTFSRLFDLNFCSGTSVIAGLQICEHLRYMPESNGGDHEKFFRPYVNTATLSKTNKTRRGILLDAVA